MKTSHRSMHFERGSSHPALLILVAAALAIASEAGIVKADVLYDRTDMTDNQTWNQVYTSSITLFNGGWDRQLADDFELLESYTITSVTADMKDNLPADIPADGFLIEIFSVSDECIGGPGGPCPSEVPSVAAFFSSYVATQLLEIGENYHRYTIDLTEAGITLGPGNWWISIVAVDESGEDSSLDRYNILVTNDLPKGVPVAGRAGGEDHGNGYQGGVSSDWHQALFGAGEQTPSDAAIRIEGTLVRATTTTPDDFNAFRGFLASGTLADLLASDDSDLCYEPGIVLNPTEAPVTLDFFGTLPNDSPATLDVTIESSANTVGLEITISFWNFNTNLWDIVGTDTQSLNADTVKTFAGTPADHVEPGTGEVRTRYEVRQTGIVFIFPWLDCVDHVFWSTTN